MGQVSRRALLARAGFGTGAGVVALLGGAAVPAFAAPGEADLANARLICSSKRLMINWYTRWLNSPKALGGVASTRELLLDIRSQEQAGYGLLAPLLTDSAPVDDDFTFTFPAGALRSPAAAVKFGIDIENMMLGIAIGASATVADPAVATSIASVVGSDGMHLAALNALGGVQVIPDALPVGLGVDDASNQLSQFLSN
jgi:Ferritin-like domain